MDPRIEALKSTTFLGRRFTRRQIADIQEMVALLPNDSRNELSKAICENLNWTTPKGEYRVSAGLRFLEHLEECGILTLPEKRNTAAKSAPKPIVHVRASDPQPEIACGFEALEPLVLEEAGSPEDVALWNALVDRYHYLGCPRPFGASIRWFVRNRHGRPLAVLLFEAAARMLPARDEWIGWSGTDRERRLHLAVSNSRFLVVPAKVEEVMGTAAQIWMEQGKAAGIVEGKADTFLRQTRLKFGELSSAQAEQVRNASPEQLDAWLGALLSARDIDGVLGERTRH